VGEQSNAYRILLRYDRKSRHRRIKKQRRYERLAATSQFRYTDRLRSRRRPSHLSAQCGPVDGCTLSGGRSPYLRYPTKGSGNHTLASVEPPSYDIQGARSAADCLYSSDCDPPAPEQTLPGGVTFHSLVPKTSRVPRIQECRPTLSQHNMDRRSD
jgi:hypothetical protein